MPQVDAVHHHRSKKLAIIVGLGLLAVVLVVAAVGVAMFINKPKPKSAAAVPKTTIPSNATYSHVVTAADVARAHDNVVAQGVVQSFDGKVMAFLPDGSKQVLKLTVTASTAYSKGNTFASAQADDLKAGSRASVYYDVKTNEAVRVGYDL